MKQFDTITKNFGGNSFFIRPFGAFDASRITGELSATLIPLISGLLPAVSNANDVDDLKDVNIDYDRLGPSLASSFSSLDGEKLEHLLRLLLVDKNNISVRIGGETEVQALTYDIANDIFAGDLQDMFFQETRRPIWRSKVNPESDYERFGELDLSAFNEIELRLYCMIKAGIASKEELENCYTLDEALKLYALFRMDQDIEYGHSLDLKDDRR